MSLCKNSLWSKGLRLHNQNLKTHDMGAQNYCLDATVLLRGTQNDRLNTTVLLNP